MLGDHHIKIVYELAKKYSSEYGADEEIVSLAALLHDIASVTNANYTENHHEAIISKENYDKIHVYDDRPTLMGKKI